MLQQLNIKNFAIVKSLDIDWHSGMTSITGETGAGKSIAIDGLGLCLGNRANASAVRPGSNKTELSACFDVTENKDAQKWLQQNDIHLDDDCILRRIITAEGRSKSYINGSPVPLAQLKELGQLLINIHGQHDHQLIVKSATQRKMLDDYADHKELLNNVSFCFDRWQQLNFERSQLQENHQNQQAQQQLLQYQLQELDEFNICDDEFEQLEVDYKKNSNAQMLLDNSLQAIHQLSNNEQQNVADQLRNVIDKLSEIAKVDSSASSYLEQLNDALIQIEDVEQELRHYSERLELDPENFQMIEDRYSLAILLAKKHQVLPENLFTFHQELKQQISSINDNESRLILINEEIEQAELQYKQAAHSLSASRAEFAEKLSENITNSMRELNMEYGKFSVQIECDQEASFSRSGIDNIRFLVSINPGQSLEAMHKVASGGELSRISLAMQVILSKKVTSPSLIFDEVDVGISGPTAAMVGEKLKQLANNTQVICVTHLPQVASKAHQQLFVAKLTDGTHTETTVTELTEQGRVKEIARLLAGDTITDSSIANAQELLAG